MALQTADRVKESTTTTGTGAVSLGGALIGFRAFSSVCSNGDTVFYGIQEVDTNGNPTGLWEVGLGTYATSGNTLARTTVLSSSNSGSLVTLASGSAQVWIDHPGAWATTVYERHEPPNVLTAITVSASAFAWKGYVLTCNKTCWLTGIDAPVVNTVASDVYQGFVATANTSGLTISSAPVFTEGVTTATSTTSNEVKCRFLSPVLLLAGTSYIFAFGTPTPASGTYVLPINTSGSLMWPFSTTFAMVTQARVAQVTPASGNAYDTNSSSTVPPGIRLNIQR